MRPKPEVEYIINELSPTQCRIAKFEDGEHIRSYLVEDKSCQCWQSNRSQCRHMRMRKEWRSLGSPSPTVVDFERNTYKVGPLEEGMECL